MKFRVTQTIDFEAPDLATAEAVWSEASSGTFLAVKQNPAAKVIQDEHGGYNTGTLEGLDAESARAVAAPVE